MMRVMALWIFSGAIAILVVPVMVRLADGTIQNDTISELVILVSWFLGGFGVIAGAFWDESRGDDL